MQIDSFLDALRQQFNPEKAAADKRYHKSEREHWGIPTPLCDKLAKEFSREMATEDLLEFAQALWLTNQFDSMVCASKILSLKRLKGSSTLWKIIKSFLKDVDGWALEDGLAHAAWKCILADQKCLDDLEKWNTHPNFWMRRATLVYTLPFAKKGMDPERMLAWASSYSADPEWFMQKAIGWWLRVLGAHNPARVLLFLQKHWKVLKAVAKKEATRKLTLNDQEMALIKSLDF